VNGTDFSDGKVQLHDNASGGNLGDAFVDAETGIVDTQGSSTVVKGSGCSTSSTSPIKETSSLTFNDTSSAWMYLDPTNPDTFVYTGAFTVDFWMDIDYPTHNI